jgi:hypothetical protein
MPEKMLETKGIAEMSAIQLSNGSGTGERARGWCEGMAVLNSRGSGEGIPTVRGWDMGVLEQGSSNSCTSVMRRGRRLAPEWYAVSRSRSALEPVLGLRK